MTQNNRVGLCPLASGSRGNSLFVSCGSHRLLIDAGLSGIEIQRRLKSINIEPESLTAIIITHEHSDHIKGAGVLSRRFNLPLYITEPTHKACAGLGKIDDLRFFQCGESFCIDNIMVHPFATCHDAADPVGLTIQYNGYKIGIATDLGIVTALVKEKLKSCNILYLESNHDPDMLINGPYPWHLKQRIKGRTGHLSNMDAGGLVAELQSQCLKHVILAHLSEENNHPAKAVHQIGKAIGGQDICIHVAGPDNPGQFIKL